MPEGSTLSGPPAERTALGGDVHLTMAMPERDGSVEVGLDHGNKTVATARLSPDVPCQQFSFDGDTLKIDMTVCANAWLGAITATGAVQILYEGTWETIFSLDNEQLVVRAGDRRRRRQPGARPAGRDQPEVRQLDELVRVGRHALLRRRRLPRDLERR